MKQLQPNFILNDSFKQKSEHDLMKRLPILENQRDPYKKKPKIQQKRPKIKRQDLCVSKVTEAPSPAMLLQRNRIAYEQLCAEQKDMSPFRKKIYDAELSKFI